MRPTIYRPFTALAAAATVLLSAGAADAACKKMGFLVNDYGKDGPTKDAQDLLDKHVAEWAAQNGIKNYTIGKKDVSCELFLDFIVFDEHTCTASANVCWDEPGKSAQPKSVKAKDSSATKSADNEKKSSKTAAPAAEKSADAPEAAAPSAIETGTVTPEAKPAASPAAAEDDAAARAAAAAERAAQAAERAAAAAEKAAAASKTASPPSQLEMPGFGAGQPAQAAPAAPTDPKS
jgi:hypothetical protein